MKFKILLLLCLVVLLTTTVESNRRRRRNRLRRFRTTTTTTLPPFVAEVLENSEESDEDDITEEEAENLDLKLQALQETANEEENEVEVENREPEKWDFPEDPCAKVKCGPSRECNPTEDGKARCECIKSCPTSEEEGVRSVCSNYNETWTSDCELYKARCECDEAGDDCVNPMNKHLHIDYFGECSEMPECKAEELEDFPRRMRDWLFNIMREMADRRELSPHFLQKEREAERTTDETKRAGVAAVWKFCDLDSQPNDRSVSRHELFPIRAPLLTLEHCIAPFLDNCDADNDHRITLEEWGQCLQVPAEEMEDRCDDVRDNHEDLEYDE